MKGRKEEGRVIYGDQSGFDSGGAEAVGRGEECGGGLVVVEGGEVRSERGGWGV